MITLSSIIPHKHFTPLSDECKKLVWVNTILGLLCLSSVVNIPLAFIIMISFAIVANVVPARAWKPWMRLALFFPLIALVFFQLGSVNRELGTAALAITMIVKYTEIHSRNDVTIMVLCNILAPFVAFFQKETVVIWSLGVMTIVVSLMALQSAFGYGSATTVWSRGKSVLLSVVGWTLLLLPLSLAVYFLAPRTDSPLWGGMHSRSKTGMGDQMDVSQWTELFNDLSTAFRVRYEGKVPPPSEMYFRGVTLWTFDGKVWSSVPLYPEIVRPVPFIGDASRPGYTYSVSYLMPTNKLFAMDFPTATPTGTVVFSDGHISMTSAQPKTRVVKWHSAAAGVSELSQAERTSALQLPRGLNPRTVAQAKKWRAQFSSDEQYISFVMKRFASEYAYSLSPPPVSSPHVVDSFVFDTKVGFCAHYSSAFAVMMRAANIPTRIVNGYVGSEMDDVGGYFRIRQADAHAWDEVWLNGRWVRFDPTFQVTTVRTRSDLSWELFNQTYTFSDWLSSNWGEWFLSYDQAAREQLMEKIKAKLGSWVALVSLAVLSVVVAVAWVVWGVWFGRRPKGEDLFVLRVNGWFAQFPLPDPNAGWEKKLKAIAPLLTASDFSMAQSVVRAGQAHLYGGQKTNLSALWKRLKPIKRRVQI